MKETGAETLRRYIRALQPVSCKALGEALGWTNEKTRMTAKAMVKRGHLVRDHGGLLTIGEPPKKASGQGKYSRSPQPRLLNQPKPVQVERFISSDEWLTQSPLHQIHRLGNGDVSKASRFLRLKVSA